MKVEGRERLCPPGLGLPGKSIGATRVAARVWPLANGGSAVCGMTLERAFSSPLSSIAERNHPIFSSTCLSLRLRISESAFGGGSLGLNPLILIVQSGRFNLLYSPLANVQYRTSIFHWKRSEKAFFNISYTVRTMNALTDSLNGYSGRRLE